ncbi:uncharacterized protein LOC135388035 isoform X1 [Ornithodoros turicata]|uniref:uncharacterized protein LOC135388035 isoform X1 n=2 Tax=Ornithodoros turicata TaxID=34597 RepID=UPI003139428E
MLAIDFDFYSNSCSANQGMSDSSDLVCVVEHGASRKKIVVGGKRMLDDIKNALLGSPFKELMNRDLIVQVFDATVNDFIDFEESDVLEATRLRHVLGSSLSTCTSKSTSPSIENDQGLAAEQDPGTSCSTVGMSALSSALNISANEYRFPVVPHHIRAEIATIKDGSLSFTQKSDIVNWLYYDLTKYTLYPGKLYSVCAQQLVSRYPKLRDTTTTGYGTWVMSLRFKAKNVRRRLPSGTALIDEAREKAKKKASVPSPTPAPSSAPCHGATNQVTETGDGEDEETIAAHLAILTKEMKKPFPDMEKVDLSMDRTFHARKSWMYREKPFVAEILQKYPALRNDDQISHEFRRHTGIDCDSGILGFVNKYGEKVLNLASRKGPGKHPVTEFWKVLDAEKEETKKYVLAVGVLHFLPLLVREKAGVLFKKLENEEDIIHPMVVYSGEDVFTSECVYVHVECLKIDALDMTSAVCILMAAYWAFNIKYAPDAVRTLSLLETFIGVNNPRMGVLCSQAIAALRS